MNKNSASLVEDFQRYFTLELATTPAQLEYVYRVRYRVYCEEFHYEPVESFPEQLEKDEFDAISKHCVVMHKASGMPAGCARLVLADEHSLMPMEKFCGDAIDTNIIRSFDNRRDSICEFSRLGVDGAFRRRMGERESRFGEISALDCSQREQRTFSLIAVATILSALAMSELIGRPHCFAMMENFLPRLLRRSGMVVQPAGRETEYHGSRSPYFWDTREVVVNMADELQDFYAAICADFSASGLLSASGSAAQTKRISALLERRGLCLHPWPSLAF
ncbi:MAG: PEP-CTERM/exosortase system-associated acyltransferase [Halioglobus sp.]